jgi:uncharacterized protein
MGDALDENSNYCDDEIFDVSPFVKLFIDKDGRWYQNGVEMIHPGICTLFYGMLEKTWDGSYQVKMGAEICSVEVEDAPFVVTEVIDGDRGSIWIALNDGSSETLNPEGFWIGAENVPYCRVKDGSLHARFSRPAYYQLANHIDSDDDEENFFLVVSGRKHPVKLSPP